MKKLWTGHCSLPAGSLWLAERFVGEVSVTVASLSPHTFTHKPAPAGDALHPAPLPTEFPLLYKWGLSGPCAFLKICPCVICLWLPDSWHMYVVQMHSGCQALGTMPLAAEGGLGRAGWLTGCLPPCSSFAFPCFSLEKPRLLLTSEGWL